MRSNRRAASFPCKIEAALQAVNLPEAVRESNRATPKKRPHHVEPLPVQHVDVKPPVAQPAPTNPTTAQQRSSFRVPSASNSEQRVPLVARSQPSASVVQSNASPTNSVRIVRRHTPVPNPAPNARRQLIPRQLPANSAHTAQLVTPAKPSSHPTPTTRHSIPVPSFSNSTPPARRLHFYTPGKPALVSPRQPPSAPFRNSAPLASRPTPTPCSSVPVPPAHRRPHISSSSNSATVARAIRNPCSSTPAPVDHGTTPTPRSSNSAPTTRRTTPAPSSSNSSAMIRRSTLNPFSRTSAPVNRRPQPILSSSQSTRIIQRQNRNTRNHSNTARSSLRAQRSASLGAQPQTRRRRSVATSGFTRASSSHLVANQSPVRPQQATLLDFSAVLDAPLQRKYATVSGQRPNKVRRVGDGAVRVVHSSDSSSG